ncbi:MAG: MarC family protein [Syntrophus sp. (in: bacteria)]
MELTLFIGTFTTLLAVINPLEALPVYLKLLDGQDQQAHRRVAFRSCLYAALMMLFFLVFGRFVLEIFGVPLSMVRIVGGIILMRIGFSLFLPSSSGSVSDRVGGTSEQSGNIAFVPLAIPLMFGPGALATVMGMSTMVKLSKPGVISFFAIFAAILATMLVTYLSLAYAKKILGRIGPLGIDAVTRLVGFFVSAMGMGLIFHGLVEAIGQYGIIAK